MARPELDDAAAAALHSIAKKQAEYVGLLYGDGLHTEPVTSGSNRRASGAFKIPVGSLSGLYHNHPPQDRGEFSDRDMKEAQRLGVPSYIAARDKIMRYDPATGSTEEVLAQFPLQEIRKKYLVQGLLK